MCAPAVFKKPAGPFVDGRRVEYCIEISKPTWRAWDPEKTCRTAPDPNFPSSRRGLGDPTWPSRLSRKGNAKAFVIESYANFPKTLIQVL